MAARCGVEDGRSVPPAWLTALWLLCGLRGDPDTRLEAQLFRVTLLRRLQLPLPFTERTCRCGLPLDSLGHHQAACARAGVLLESVAARICRDGGGRVTTNVLVRDLDLALPGAVADGRRLEVVVDGLPLFGGAQLAVDTTLVCVLRSDGRPRAAVEDGAKVTRARRRKETTYPELVGLVVLGVEVGGRFSTENSILRKRVEQAWRFRWGSLLACTTARAVASSLLGCPVLMGHTSLTRRGACVEATQLVVSL